MRGNLTLKLIKIIGSPFIEENPATEDEIENKDLYILAVKNKIPLLYLESLKKRGKLKKLDHMYQKEKTKYLNLINSISKVSKIFNSAEIDY